MLAIILEVFNTRALSGAQISEEHKEYWEAWFRKVREILSAIYHDPGFPATMDADEKNWWQAQLPELRPNVKFDLLQSAALSAILIPEIGGKTQDTDCSAAKSLPYRLVALPQPPEKIYEDGITEFTLAGVAEQIKGRIETTCGP